MIENSILKKIKKLNVTIIGDLIIDGYQFIDPIGKASKSATITANLLDLKFHLGGAGVIANHVSSFAKSTNLISYLGRNSSLDSSHFILKSLSKKVKFKGVHLEYKPNVVKKRYVDNAYRSNKLLEVNEINNVHIKKPDIIKLIDLINYYDKLSDIVIVADFGHGLLENKLMINAINNLKSHVALMVQTNSLNFGFNLITKYKKADYFVIDKREASLALNSQDNDMNKKIKLLSKKLNSRLAIITTGKSGCIVFDKVNNKIFNKLPPSNNEIVFDTVGAGDAFFSITSLLSFYDIDSSVVADFGNMAGQYATSYLGNEKNLSQMLTK